MASAATITTTKKDNPTLPGEVMAGSDAQSCELCGSPTGHVESRDWHMPLTLSSELMRRIGEAVWRQLPGDVGVHLVVVANAGFGVGVGAVMAAPVSRLRSVTVVKPMYDFDLPDLVSGADEAVVILDNSLHTGRSVARVVEHLCKRGIPVAAIVTVFDGANACESQARCKLTTRTGVPVLACARWADRQNWI